MGSPLSSAEDRISTIVEHMPAVAPFELSAGPYAASAFAVRSLRGREAVSEPFSFEVTIAASSDVDDAGIEADLLGKPAHLTMHAGESSPRFVRGVVASVEALGLAERGRPIYRLRLVPRLWLLGKRKTSRIFQERTVPEIVSAVLQEAGVLHAFRLVGKYRPRTYCVEYQETDLAFVARLLAEEGIFYFIDHGSFDAASETVIFCDNARQYPAIEGDPVLCFRDGEGSEGLVPAEHHVVRFTRKRTIAPSSVLRRAYDFRRPVLDLSATSDLSKVTGELLPAEIYEHHSEDEQPTTGDAAVVIELEQHRAPGVVVEGASACRRLLPGGRFTLVDHPMDRLDQEYAITSVTHEGVAPSAAKPGEAVYANNFTCVPAGVAARPPRPERAVQQVIETAVVVGPEGQEIYADEFGRVKVQFPWDREGRKNEHCSCWIRVSQAWAGTGWGAQFIPRIGMEVVVTFLGGDVDRPLITGCVPNAINVPAFALPEHQTRSGIRTRSTPTGVGFNELSFEDSAGREKIHIHAQRDLDEVIEHDRSLLVKADDRVVVGGARSCETLGDSRVVVGGSAEVRVTSDRAVRVGGDEHREIAGAAEVATKGDHTVRVRGCCTTLVGTSKSKRSYVLHVEGTTQLSSTGLTAIEADKGLVLRCGKSSIRITEDAIELCSPSISVSGEGGGLTIDEALTIRAKEEAHVLADKMLFKSSGASVSLSTEAQIDGKKILLNSPASASDPVTDKSPEPTKIELVEQNGRPISHQRYLVKIEDGSEVSGILDEHGKAEIMLDGSGTITFPGLRIAKAA
ncbi:MAG: type VI secretion system tip protein TssI/VgrG [Byssovorax sp.]